MNTEKFENVDHIANQVSLKGWFDIWQCLVIGGGLLIHFASQMRVISLLSGSS
jgi:hypothetical protein